MLWPLCSLECSGFAPEALGLGARLFLRRTARVALPRAPKAVSVPVTLSSPLSGVCLHCGRNRRSPGPPTPSSGSCGPEVGSFSAVRICRLFLRSLHCHRPRRCLLGDILRALLHENDVVLNSASGFVGCRVIPIKAPLLGISDSPAPRRPPGTPRDALLLPSWSLMSIS